MKGLSIAFEGRKVVEDLSYTLRRGETLGIVGESGSGKSVSTLALMGLLPKKASITGSALLSQSELKEQKEHADDCSDSSLRSDCDKKTNLLELDEEQMREVRGRRISMIFQEPMTSLNPVQKCGEQVLEMMQGGRSKAKGDRERVIQLFKEVLLPRPEKIFDSYPHEISGGQKQRVMIAMALINHPDILIADEPTTALDVTVQKTILELLKQLQQKYGTSIIFITHDLGVIGQIADRIMVMYRGKVVEQGLAKDILHNPKEPYTKGLLACRPPLDSRPERLPTVEEFLNGVIQEGVKESEKGVKGSERTNAGENLEGVKGSEEGVRGSERTNAGENLEGVKGSEEGVRGSERTNAGENLEGVKGSETLDGVKGSEKGVRGSERTIAGGSETVEGGDASVGAGKQALISVKNLSVTYTLKKSLFGKALQTLKGVDGITFDIMEGETLGLVGESGCGKSTLGRALLRLIDHSDGSILYRGQSLDSLSSRQMRALRPKLQIIFQDPYSSLNPRITIGDAISEPLKVHGGAERHRTLELMEQVGLNPDWYSRYPHELSGGQRQRVCIARALILQPELVVCDESVSALDVSVQAQVLNLLNDLKRQHHYTYLFITHDLSVVKFLSDRIMVMQKGKIVESGTPDNLFARPQTDYTKTLIDAIPRID